jgi:hypothetical protein
MRLRWDGIIARLSYRFNFWPYEIAPLSHFTPNLTGRDYAFGFNPPYALLASICAQLPIHLLLMTASEETEVKFIQGQSAVEMSGKCFTRFIP